MPAKLTQTTVKYFYVTARSYSSPNTTVTINGGSDYSLANAAITSPHYSYAQSPLGFPLWFNYSPTWTGFSLNPSGVVARFTLHGKTCYVVIRVGAAGVSNTTTMTVTAPIASLTLTNATWFSAGVGIDNSVVQASPSRASILSGTTTINCYKTMESTSTWTNSGSKAINFTLMYEVA
jgi:hypothetical protein